MKLKYKLPLINAIVLMIGFVIIWNLSFRITIDFFVKHHSDNFQKEVNLETEKVNNLIEMGISQLKIIKEFNEIKSLNWDDSEEICI